MGRPKKVLEPDVVESVVEVSIPAPTGITRLELDLGRDDLNVAVAKLNEVIEKVNSI